MLKSKVAPSEQLSMVIAPHRGRWPYDGVPWWAKLYCRGICCLPLQKSHFLKSARVSEANGEAAGLNAGGPLDRCRNRILDRHASSRSCRM